jgi:DtxR family transcriptional regulator, Mn-dependent transcriptional regulator
MDSQFPLRTSNLESRFIAMTQPSLGSTLRDFLLEIYQISEHAQVNGNYLVISDLTQIMYASPASLNRAIGQLKKLGLVDHQPYRGIRLTEEGRQMALPLIRRYRIAEVFLNRVMNFEWHEVHDEAKRLMGGMNEIMTQRMFELAGSPLTCPHGEPIPALDGSMTGFDDQPVHHAPIKTNVIITRVLAREPERLKYIGALRLLPGTTLQVIHVAPFDGPLQLKLTGDYRIIGHNLAEVIYVRPE